MEHLSLGRTNSPFRSTQNFVDTASTYVCSRESLVTFSLDRNGRRDCLINTVISSTATSADVTDSCKGTFERYEYGVMSSAKRAARSSRVKAGTLRSLLPNDPNCTKCPSLGFDQILATSEHRLTDHGRCDKLICADSIASYQHILDRTCSPQANITIIHLTFRLPMETLNKHNRTLST